MTYFGRILTYDVGKGLGTIAPLHGGAILEFARSDLQLGAPAPKTGDHFGYRTRPPGKGLPQATDLRHRAAGLAANDQGLWQPR